MTAPRAFLERELLPSFAARFAGSARVLNVGAGRHSYQEWFAARVVTADRNPACGCDETFPAEEIPYASDSVDGILFVGVFERLDDPMQAMRELYRVLRPGGFLLFGALDRGFEARKPCDRWRLTEGGATLVAAAFTTVERYHVDGLAHFLVLQKPTVSAG